MAAASTTPSETQNARYNLQPPKYDGTGDFENFLKSFDLFLKITKIPKEEHINLLVYCSGEKATQYYFESERPAEETYENVQESLKTRFALQRNASDERMKLYTSKQNQDTLLDYASRLRKQIQFCKFPDAFKNEALRDAFCLGLSNQSIKQTCIRAYYEADKLSQPFLIEQALAAATAEDIAIKSSDGSFSLSASVAASSAATSSYRQANSARKKKTTGTRKNTCYRCGADYSPEHAKNCKARNSKCRNCGKTGHWDKVCNATSTSGDRNICGAKSSVSRKYLNVKINGVEQNFLLDTGSDITVVDIATAKSLHLLHKPAKLNVSDFGGMPLEIVGKCFSLLEIDGRFVSTDVWVARKICEPAILGESILQQFRQVVINYPGNLMPLVVAAGTSKSNAKGFNIDPFPIIALSEDARPIRVPTRKFSDTDKKIIKSTIDQLLKDGIIEESISSWRAQPLLVRQPDKVRMCVDYSTTVNRYTSLDAYPIPLVSDLIDHVGKWKHFSSLDLKAAYHQLPLLSNERPLTAFEACGKLYQFKFLPFGVTNGGSAFQRAMHKFFSHIPNVVNYLDDVLIGGETQAEHDKAYNEVMKIVRENNIELNDKKCKLNVTEINFLGHIFGKGTIRPDPQRFSALLEMALPTSQKELRRLIGLFVYFSKWVPNFSDTALPLFLAQQENLFPLSNECVESINQIKNAIVKALLYIPKDNVPLVLETDASLSSVAGILTQEGRPVAFYSHKLSNTEKRWSVVELEAFAIYKAISCKSE